VAFAITRGAAGHSKSSGKAFKVKWVGKPTALPSLLQSFVSCYVLWVGKPLFFVSGFKKKRIKRVGKPYSSAASRHKLACYMRSSLLKAQDEKK